KNSKDHQPLAGASATINSINKNAIADSSGVITFTNIPPGTYHVSISYVGWKDEKITVHVPRESNTVLDVALQENEEPEEEIIVTATRTSRTISDIPTRVETISGEELAEKENMKPGDIRMLLSES